MRVCAAYARQSVEKKDSLSIAGQLELCRQMAGGRELWVYRDAGYSGKNTARPDFQRLLRDIRADRIAALYVYRLDRFSRSVADFGRLWEILQEHQVEFVSVNERFDTSTPMGRAMLHIIMVFAQLERETTAERVRDNYYNRVSLGAWPGGPAPFGYAVGRTAGAQGRRIPTLMIQDQWAAAVREIFRRYAEDSAASLRKIAGELSRRGVGEKRWNSCTVSRLLQNPVYVQAEEQVRLFYLGCGVQVLSPLEDFDGVHGGIFLEKQRQFALLNSRGIVPAELWLSCQERLAKNRQIGNAGRGTHSWLSGLMKCAECGYSITVQTQGERRRLSCSGRYRKERCRSCIRVKVEELESVVEEGIQALWSEAVLWERREPSSLEKEDAEYRRKKERLIRAFAACEELSGAEFRQTLRRLEADCQRQRGDLSRPATEKKVSEWSFFEKKTAAAQFIERILVGEEGVSICWRV